MSGFQYGRTLFDNDSEHPDELSFQKGEILIILNTHMEGAVGWWLCKKGSKIGIAPGNFLETLPSSFVPLKAANPKLEAAVADRSSRAPSGEYSQPRKQKMFLGEGESQLNVHHRQVEEAYNRLNNHYGSDVLKCDEYDLMKWGSVVRHFWTLCENFSSSILLFSKFVRISILETIDENVDFVIVGKISNKLNNVDHDYQGLMSLFKITKLVFNEHTAKNINSLIERVEKLPSQVNEIFATLKANKNMFFTEEAPKWAKRGPRRQSYEDVDCMDFLTQAIEIRNRNEVNLEAQISLHSVPSSPSRIVESSGITQRSRSRTALVAGKLSLPAENKIFFKLHSNSDQTDIENEKKRCYSISNSIAKLKIKSSSGMFCKSTKSNKVNKIDISSPSNPQILQSVTSDFSFSKARTVTMATPELLPVITSSPDFGNSKRRVMDSTIQNDVTIMADDPDNLPLTPGGYEPMKSVFSTFTPNRTPLVTIIDSAPRQKPSELPILTDLYLQLEQVSAVINTSVPKLKAQLSHQTPDVLAYTPLVQNLVAQIYKCVFLIETTKSQLNNTTALSETILTLTVTADSFIRKCQESLKTTPFSPKLVLSLIRLSDELTNEMAGIGRSVMELRDDSMSSTEV